MICILLCVLLLGFGSGVVSLVNIMIINGKKYATMAADQQLSTTAIEAKRGTIYDCNGNILATSATVWTVYITPQDIENDDEARLIADGLAEILELDADAVYEKTQKNTSYERVKKRVEENVAIKVREFISDNSLGSIVGLDEANKRYYPNGSLASTVLGFVGDDNQGLGGVEYQYDTTLKGVPGKVVSSKNALGSDMPFNYETMVEPQQGSSLTLTIDAFVQYCVEKHLEEAVEINYATNRGCAIVMNVNTGAILAMATEPDFDPNEPFSVTSEYALSLLEEYKNAAPNQEAGENSIGTETAQEENKTPYEEAYEKAVYEQWRNKAISDVYEPGSVFKTVTGSSAAEEGVVTPSSTFQCPGYIVVADTRYKCHDTSGHGHQNFTNIFENSCNPAFIEIGQRLGVDAFYKYFKAYGLTTKTGIDLPGEADSIYYTAEKMGPVELASESFGQTFQITPIQMITAVAAVCNGGNLVKPHVLKEVTDVNGNVTKTEDISVARQVISKETSSLMCEMLRSVVDNGSGKNAYVAGYRMAGKTGTSQKISESTDGAMKYIASFCGFAPADNPEYAVIVMIDEPHGANIYGSAVAAPVASAIMEEILPYLGVEAVYTEEEYASLNTTVPSVEGMTVDTAQSTISTAGLSCRVIGEGETVIAQNPLGGSTSPTDGNIVLYTEEDYEPEKVIVPDLTDMGVSGVSSTAATHGVNVEIVGVVSGYSGAISYRQDIEAGTQVDRGTVVKVSFRYADSVE
jgi:stage V sporulation protein D (sporulation-specific penicillin-binding protein)